MYWLVQLIELLYLVVIYWSCQYKVCNWFISYIHSLLILFMSKMFDACCLQNSILKINNVQPSKQLYGGHKSLQFVYQLYSLVFVYIIISVFKINNVPVVQVCQLYSCICVYIIVSKVCDVYLQSSINQRYAALQPFSYQDIHFYLFGKKSALNDGKFLTTTILTLNDGKFLCLPLLY